MNPTVAGMVAVVVVRDGELPAGADEAVAEAGGDALLAGTGTEAAAKDLVACRHARCAEIGPLNGVFGVYRAL